MELSTTSIIEQQEQTRREFILRHPELGEGDCARIMHAAGFYPRNTKIKDARAHVRRWRDYVDRSQ